MTNIGIVSGHDAPHTKNILSQLYERAYRSVSIYIPEDGGQPPHALQMLIVNEENECLLNYVAGLSPSGILIANADNNSILPYLKGVKTHLITYGYNQKASVTASSVTPEEIQCCIQRQLSTFSGNTLEPQEFPLEIQNYHKNVYNILGALTAALLDDAYTPR